MTDREIAVDIAKSRDAGEHWGRTHEVTAEPMRMEDKVRVSCSCGGLWYITGEEIVTLKVEREKVARQLQEESKP